VATEGTEDTYAGTYELLARDGSAAEWDGWYVTATDGTDTYFFDFVDDSYDEVTAQLTILPVTDVAGMYADPSTYLTHLLEDRAEVSTVNSDGTRKAVALADDNLAFVTNGDEKLGVFGCESNDDVDGYGDGTALVALLFDDAMNLDPDPSTDENDLIGLIGGAAVDDADEWETELKYLDLVNVNDGNAKLEIAGDGELTIFWPYPEGVTYETAGDYEFVLLHAPGISREDSSTYTFAEGEVPEVEQIALTATEDGLMFSTGSFSPYLLMWKQAETPAAPSTQDPDELTPAVTQPVGDKSEAKQDSGKTAVAPKSDAGKTVPDTTDPLAGAGMAAAAAAAGAFSIAGAAKLRRRDE
jgi:hypothetical protein